MQFVKTVVLVDDDLDDHEIFKSACAAVDDTISVTGFESGEEVIGALSKTRVLPEMIFLDLNMPRMNGVEVLEALRNISHLMTVSVIVYTTFVDSRIRSRCLQLGAADVIEKPNSFDGLCEMLGNLLKLPV